MIKIVDVDSEKRLHSKYIEVADGIRNLPDLTSIYKIYDVVVKEMFKRIEEGTHVYYKTDAIQGVGVVLGRHRDRITVLIDTEQIFDFKRTDIKKVYKKGGGVIDFEKRWLE